MIRRSPVWLRSRLRSPRRLGEMPLNTALHPAFTAVFSDAYAPSGIATLRVTSAVKNLDLQILRAGAERAWSSVGRPWGPSTTSRSAARA